MTSLTQRTSGIVQRRRTGKDGAEGGTNHDNEDNIPQEDVDEDEHDSKETRLTLMEEILLLGLKDREVCFFSIHGANLLISLHLLDWQRKWHLSC